MTTSSKVLSCIALCLLTSIAVASEVTDLRLNSFTVKEDKLGALTIDVAVGVRTCGRTESIVTDLELWVDDVQIDSQVVYVDIADDIGGTCANTKNGSCSGVSCPDAIVNGTTRSGTCEDGSWSYCVCDYGVVSLTVTSVTAVKGATYELFLDRPEAIQERNEANNYGRFVIVDGDTTPKRGSVIRLHDNGQIEELLTSGVAPRLESAQAPVRRYLEQIGDERFFVQRSEDAEGNCRAVRVNLSDSTVTHGCQ